MLVRAQWPRILAGRHPSLHSLRELCRVFRGFARQPCARKYARRFCNLYRPLARGSVDSLREPGRCLLRRLGFDVENVHAWKRQDVDHESRKLEMHVVLYVKGRWLEKDIGR